MDWKNTKFLIFVSSILIFISVLGMILPATTYSLKDDKNYLSNPLGVYGDPTGDYVLVVDYYQLTLVKHDLSVKGVFHSEGFVRQSIPVWSENGQYITIWAGYVVYILDAHNLTQISRINTRNDLRMYYYDDTCTFYLDSGLNLYYVTNLTSVYHYNIVSHKLFYDYDMNIANNVRKAYFVPDGKSILMDIYESLVLYDIATNSSQVLLEQTVNGDQFDIWRVSSSWNIIQTYVGGSYYTIDLRNKSVSNAITTRLGSISYDDTKYLTLTGSDTSDDGRLRNVEWKIADINDGKTISKAIYNKGPLYDMANEKYPSYFNNYYWFSKYDTLAYFGTEQSLEFQITNTALLISKFANFSIILNGIAFAVLFLAFLNSNNLFDPTLIRSKSDESSRLRKDWLHYYKLMLVAVIFSLFHILTTIGGNGNLTVVNYLFASAIVYLDIIIVVSLIQMSNVLFHPELKTHRKLKIELVIWVILSLLFKYFIGIGFGLVPNFPLKQILIICFWIYTIVFIDLLHAISTMIRDADQTYTKSYFTRISYLFIINALVYWNLTV